MKRINLFNKLLILLISIHIFTSSALIAQVPQNPKLWKKMDIAPFGGNKGFYPSLGDLDNDGRIDFLLHRIGIKGAVGYMIALNHDEKLLWQIGNSALPEHKYWKNEPPNRAIAIIYDIDHDNRSEVIAETFKNGLYKLSIFDGETGKIKKSIDSPFDSLRAQNSSRPHPMAFIAYMDGPQKQPTIVVKYEASNYVKGLAVGYDHNLQEKWRFQNTKYSIGHIPDIADIDDDNKDEICLGYSIIDDDGSIMWEASHPDLLPDHADMVTAADILPQAGKEILVAECHRNGKAYCYSSSGDLLWRNMDDCDHTECIWVGNFIEDRPGLELIIQNYGHIASFMSVDPNTGEKIADIKLGKQYPDWPMKVSWKDQQVQSIWMPLQRSLIDGYGNIVQNLGKYDNLVKEQLHAGVTKKQIGVQAFGLDVCGDQREELILYQPFHGEKIFIFTQYDSNGEAKSYTHQKQAYNIRTCH